MNTSNARASLYFREEPHTHPASQGFSVFEDRAYILHHTGVCCVYDMKVPTGKRLAAFPLGSYNAGKPTKDYTNHANSCMFSKAHYKENPIPLLYVTVGWGVGGDENGYFYRCAVENITCKNENGQVVYAAETLQTVSYCPEGIEDTEFISPCWGCPAFFVDNDREELYILSAKYRTKRGMLPEGESKNTYIVTTFRLPRLEEGAFVKLTPRDIKEQFTAKSDILFTQGGAYANRKIYYTFGCPPSKTPYPNEIAVFDLEKKTMTARISNLDEALNMEEIESCELYNGRLYCNTSAGGVYLLQRNLLP